jgi:hypothetical protein
MFVVESDAGLDLQRFIVVALPVDESNSQRREKDQSNNQYPATRGQSINCSRSGNRGVIGRFAGARLG